MIVATLDLTHAITIHAIDIERDEVLITDGNGLIQVVPTYRIDL